MTDWVADRINEESTLRTQVPLRFEDLVAGITSACNTFNGLSQKEAQVSIATPHPNVFIARRGFRQIVYALQLNLDYIRIIVRHEKTEQADLSLVIEFAVKNGTEISPRVEGKPIADLVRFVAEPFLFDPLGKYAEL